MNKLISTESKNTRKKLAPQHSIENNSLSIKSPNLKLDFIISEPGLPLLTFRKNEIKVIRDNIVSFLDVTKLNNIKNKYKKVLLVVGNSGTGKSSSIGVVLDEISGYIKNNIKQLVNLNALRIIYLNGNFIFNCQKIAKQIEEIDQQKGSKLLKIRVERYRKQRIKDDRRLTLDIIYIE